MKKRRKSNRLRHLRKIKVNEETYTWLISDNNCDGDGSKRLKVWRGRGLLIDVLVNGNTSVTPKYVSDAIEEYMDQHFKELLKYVD